MYVCLFVCVWGRVRERERERERESKAMMFNYSGEAKEAPGVTGRKQTVKWII